MITTSSATMPVQLSGRSRAVRIGVWAVRVLLSAQFIVGGALKLIGDQSSPSAGPPRHGRAGGGPHADRNWTMSTAEFDTGQARTALRSLERLVGSWAVTGPGTSGTIKYAWMEGEAFLVQTIDLVAHGAPTRGIEYIGWDPASQSLRSHFFSTSGEILEYTYDLTGDTLTIWFGGAGSPAKYVGTFNPDGNRNTGAWQWPGGGYESTMTRMEETAS